MNYYYNIGYKLFGPLIKSFSEFLKDNIKENEEILFVSREGIFLKKCFDILYPNIDTKIIYLSRKSVLQATSKVLLKEMSLYELSKSISLKRNATVEELLQFIGLDSEKYKNEVKFDEYIDTNIDLFFEKNKKEIINDLDNTLFNAYLKQILKNNNVLIDIGWKGSMQNLLEKYLLSVNSNKKIRGLYLGIMNTENKRGFLFEENNRVCQNILNYSGLLEIIMMPNFGSVIGYKKKNKEIVPIFDKVEFSLESSKIIQDIQNGIIKYIQDSKASIDNIDKDIIIKEMNKFGNNPSLSDIKHFQDLDFYDNGKVYHLIEKPKLNKLVSNFINTKWKTAYLKRIFKIKLPYSKMVIYLRKLKEK